MKYDTPENPIYPRSEKAAKAGRLIVLYGTFFGRGFFIGGSMEKWVDVKGFVGIYQVSNMGGLRSFKKNPSGRVLSNVNKKGGYLSVVLRGKSKNDIRYVRMHILVAEAFLGRRPSPIHEVNHIDCNKQNNRIGNLEWVTPQENKIHAVKTKPEFLDGMRKWNQETRPTPIAQMSKSGSIIKVFRNSMDAYRETGVCYRNILQVARKDEYKPGLTRKQAGGFGWKFHDKV